jgi:hypothetical protein
MSNIITLLGYDNIRKSTIIAESPNEFWNGYNSRFLFNLYNDSI